MELDGGSLINSLMDRNWKKETSMAVPDIAKVTTDFVISVALESVS